GSEIHSGGRDIHPGPEGGRRTGGGRGARLRGIRAFAGRIHRRDHIVVRGAIGEPDIVVRVRGGRGDLRVRTAAGRRAFDVVALGSVAGVPGKAHGAIAGRGGKIGGRVGRRARALRRRRGLVRVAALAGCVQRRHDVVIHRVIGHRVVRVTDRCRRCD